MQKLEWMQTSNFRYIVVLTDDNIYWMFHGPYYYNLCTGVF